MADGKKPYKVGYGRPPEHTRFKPDQSGNRNGRPKGSKNFVTELHEALNARVVVNENGKRKKISRRKAAAMQVANKAAAGDPKTLPLLLQHDIRFEQSRAAAEAAQPEAVSPENQAVMESIIRRIREAESLPAEPASAVHEDDKN